MKKIDISMVIISLLASVILTGMVSATDIASPARVTAIESPQIQFDNTSTGDDQEWIIFADELSFDIFDAVEDNDVFRRVLGITPSINSLNSFIVDSSGDINFANGSIFIDKSDNKMGIGTTTPEGDLHIAGTGMMIFDHSGSKWKVGIDTPVDSNKPVPPFPTLNSFQIHDLGSGKTPFRIYKNAPDNSFIINPAGKLSAYNSLERYRGEWPSRIA